MKSPHIVIVGAGFGGTYVARHLVPFIKKEHLKVTLINRTNYFLFTPLLHEVATGSLTPISVTEALGEIFAKTGVQVVVGDASINIDEKIVRVNGATLPFDYLVVTTGAATNYFNIPGAQEHALPLKTVGDAMQIRERVLKLFEEAHECKTREERRKMLSFVVAGGGPTGVELTAELAEFANEIEKRYHHTKGELSMTLVTADDAVLKMLPERLQKKTVEYLRSVGVRIITNKAVSEVTATHVYLSGGGSVDAGLTIWTTGVTPAIPKTTPALPSDRGRLTVDAHLRVANTDHVFALGDAAAALDRGESGKPVPMLAQAATAEANVVAKNIIATIRKEPLRTFRFRSKGTLVSLGEWHAIGTVGPFHISGPIAWYIWRTVYLFKFLSVKKRFRIAFEWTINLFTARDTSKLS